MSSTYWVVQNDRGCYWSKDWLDWVASLFHATEFHDLEKAKEVADENAAVVCLITLSCEKI